MSGQILKRLELLREKMQEAEVGVLVVPSSDCHGSEYVCPHYRAREYITGFTGSAGTAVITLKEAGLFTDGRYFIQAKRQLEGSGIHLFRQGEPGVPSVEEYIQEQLKPGELLGFDGRVIPASWASGLRQAAARKGCGTLEDRDLVGAVWEDRPSIPKARPFVLEERWSGESARERIQRVREQMEREGADAHLLASLCDVAWILNIRGRDIPGVPVLISYLYLTADTCVWYVRPSALTPEVRRHLKESGVEARDYEEVYKDLQRLRSGTRVLLDPEEVNAFLLGQICEEAVKVEGKNPSELMKAVKNERELSNLRIAHIKEGVAFTRFMRWVKTRAGQERITELTAAAWLEEQRKKQETYLEQSFAPICAYGPNAAIVHYSATEETDTELLPEGFLLVDAGGHYLEGTTDTTRTIALGPLSREQKRMFTAVCRGNLNLANAKFLKGCTGLALDVLCREPLWRMGADYKHGTGHGVGYLLNVHEGPNAFRWKLRKGEQPEELLPGMVTTDEPGVYLEGRYGIRTENELVCTEGPKNACGQFLEFENLTLTPIDLDGLLPEEMTETERAYLNAYHRKVREELRPYLDPEEREWLSCYTREI